MLFRQPKTELIAGLDIGSSAVRIAAGQMIADGQGRKKLQIIGAAQVPSAGVQRGVVTSIEELISVISQALEEVERVIGAPIEHTWVGITGTGVLCEPSRGVVSAAKADGEISAEDVARAVSAARTIAVPLNYDILHVIPRSFTVDGQSGIKDPIGMTGLRLEVDVQIIHGLSSHLKNMSRAVYRTGVDIDDIILTGLAAGEAVATPRQKELGVAVVNIGSATTSIVVYETGDVLHTVVLPLGSLHITNDLAIGLRTSIEVADRVKLNYGQCVPGGISRQEKIDLGALGGESEIVAHKYVAEIIGARVGEILEKIDAELQRINRSGLLPAGVILTGGGAKIGGLVELTKDTLRLPATLGYPIDLPSVSAYSNDLGFASAIGLVKWGSRASGMGSFGRRTGSGAARKIWQQLQRAGKWLMP